MRIVAAAVVASVSYAAMAAGVTPAAAAPSRLLEFANTDGVLRWINTYRTKPDPASVPAAVQALARLGAFKDPEQAGVYTGFFAGVIRTQSTRADKMIAKMLPLAEGDQWIIVRAIAYSDHPEWRNLLRRVGPKIPTRQVMIDKYLAGSLPTLWQITPDEKETAWDTVRSYVTFEKLRGKEPSKEVKIESSPELLDTFWGYYFATGTHRPISRIITMLPLSKDGDSVDKLTLGSMAKYTLASNAARDAELLAMLKRTREYYPKESVAVLNEVIDAAETAETARLRKEAMAAIEELRRKGPGSRRAVSMWGQVGQGALALGCIAAAAAGQVALGLPCVIGGGVSSAALNFWEKQ